jgi:AraC family transcriptional regulator of adaptative response / DNA-3-methyladenine glycosylase II
MALDQRVSRRLPYAIPFDGPGLIEFLRARAVPGVEEVLDGVYRRSVRLRHGPGVIELEARRDHVAASYLLSDRRDLGEATARSRALFDLDSDPQAVLDVLGSDPLLGPHVRATPGRRVPGVVDADELAFRAVLGQQISLAGAATAAARLTVEYGEALPHPVGSVTHLFPTAGALADADPERLAMPWARRRALITLARALASGQVGLDAGADHEQTRRRLLELPGIGPWTVEYIAMRALKDPDAFLATDLGVRHALELLGQDPKPPAATALAERWRPYRAYALQHLWALLWASKLSGDITAVGP